MVLQGREQVEVDPVAQVPGQQRRDRRLTVPQVLQAAADRLALVGGRVGPQAVPAAQLREHRAEQPVAEAVEGEDLGHPRHPGGRHAPPQSLPQAQRRGVVEGQHQELPRGPAPGDPAEDPVGDRLGLARAGRGQQPDRCRLAGDERLLVGIGVEREVDHRGGVVGPHRRGDLLQAVAAGGVGGEEVAEVQVLAVAAEHLPAPPRRYAGGPRIIAVPGGPRPASCPGRPSRGPCRPGAQPPDRGPRRSSRSRIPSPDDRGSIRWGTEPPDRERWLSILLEAARRADPS